MTKVSYKYLLVGVAVLGVLAGGVVYLRPTQKLQKDSPSPTVASNQVVSSTLPKVVVSYVPADEMPLSQTELVALRLQINHLKNTGSTSAGVLTTEFKKATHAKMTYRFGRRQKLSFKPVSLQKNLPEGFILTGRQYEGVMGEQGFDGLYRLFEKPNTKARLEITQSKITKQPLLLPKELFDQELDGVPLRLESLTDKKGVAYYHGEFVHQDSYISITSKGVALADFVAIIQQIITQK